MTLVYIVIIVGLLIILCDTHNNHMYCQIRETRSLYFSHLRDLDVKSEEYKKILEREKREIEHFESRLWTWENFKKCFKRKG